MRAPMVSGSVVMVPFLGAGLSGPVYILAHAQGERKYLPTRQGEQASEPESRTGLRLALTQDSRGETVRVGSSHRETVTMPLGPSQTVWLPFVWRQR